MSTVHDQPPRRDRTSPTDKNWILDLKDLSAELEMPIDTVISALALKELRRRNDLYVDNGDAWDEQMSGLVHALEDGLSGDSGDF
jgi:hypothetical protein